MEQYASGRDELNVTLTRVFFLRMANVFALITSLYNTVTEVSLQTNSLYQRYSHQENTHFSVNVMLINVWENL